MKNEEFYKELIDDLYEVVDTAFAESFWDATMAARDMEELKERAAKWIKENEEDYQIEDARCIIEDALQLS